MTVVSSMSSAKVTETFELTTMNWAVSDGIVAATDGLGSVVNENE